MATLVHAMAPLLYSVKLPTPSSMLHLCAPNLPAKAAGESFKKQSCAYSRCWFLAFSHGPCAACLPACLSQQGDLYLEFELLFPTRLSQQQKMLLAAGLYLPAKPDTAASKALRDFEAAYRDTKHGWSSGVLKDEAAAGADGQ
jgi:hypothetical protein